MIARRKQYPIWLDGAKILVDQTTVKGRVTRYSVTLVAWIEERWETIRVFDNVHGRHEMHRYTRSGGKQSGILVYHGENGAAMRAAKDWIENSYERMIEGWL